MTLTINTLSTSESALFIRNMLSSQWPDTHFGVRLDGNTATLSWTDGPTVTNATTVVEHFLADPNVSDWSNTTLVSHPNNQLEAVVCTLDDVKYQRDHSPRLIHTILPLVAQAHPHVTDTMVEHALASPPTDNDPVHTLVNELAAEQCSAQPPQSWVTDSSTLIEDDHKIISLCNALTSWHANPDAFNEWETIIAAIHHTESQAVLASTLFDNDALAHSTRNLLITVANYCDDHHDFATGNVVDDLLSWFPEVGQDALFGMSKTMEDVPMVPMGTFLRTTVVPRC